MIYKPVKGSRLTEEQAQRYGESIAAMIEEGDGKIDSQTMVKKAKAKRSPLHDFFEWDDTVAAHQYRLKQAGYLLRSIQVVVKIDDNEEEVRAFHNVIVASEENGNEENGRTYVQVDRVLTEPELKEQIIEQALKALISWKKKYQQYKELAGVIKAIDALKSAVG